jgi:hypothetical protein
VNPQGTDCIAWMQQLAGRVDQLLDRSKIEAALDDVGYLMEALDPALQEPAYQLAEELRRRLEQFGA